MVVPIVDLEVCSLALLQIGCWPLASTVSSREGELCERLYPFAVEGLLSSYPWSFATTEVRLSPVSGVEKYGWEYVYLPPAEILRIIALESEGGEQVDYARMDRYLYAEVAPAVLYGIKNVAPSFFPAYFRTALVARLAYLLSMPLTEDSQRTQMLYQLAEKETKDSRTIDAQSKPPQRLRSFPLVEVR